MENPAREARNKLTYEEAKTMMITARGAIAEMLSLALEFGDITQRQYLIISYRLIDWHSLEQTGKQFGLTRERIRQIEAKVELILRELTKNPLKPSGSEK